MSTSEIRDGLRRLETAGSIRSWFEMPNGSFVVAVGAGPNIKVRNKRDMDALLGILLRKVAGVR